MGRPEGGERTESLFKQVIDQNFPNLWKELDIQIKNLTKHVIISMKKTFSKTHYTKTIKLMTKKEFSKKLGRKKDSNLQRKSHQIIIRFFSINSTSQE